MRKSKFVEYAFGISAILFLILGMGEAFAEQHNFINELPIHLEIIFGK
jgi:hypothetical protein